jgi:hypothetical protein
MFADSFGDAARCLLSWVILLNGLFCVLLEDGILKADVLIAAV